jgi:uncharacterized membrane protein YhaH (DUF805 family)
MICPNCSKNNYLEQTNCQYCNTRLTKVDDVQTDKVASQISVTPTNPSPNIESLNSKLEAEITELRQNRENPGLICSKCGKPAINSIDKFCSFCGYSLVEQSGGGLIRQECPHCDSPILSDGKFCAVCGQEFSGEAVSLWQAVSYLWCGRLNRLGAAIMNLLLYLTGIFITPLAMAESTEGVLAFWVLICIALVFQVGVMISRVHDIGKSGWVMIPWLVSSFVYGWYGTPIVTVIFFAIALPYALWPGEDTVNRWGAPGVGFTRYWKRIVGRY